MIRPVHLSDTLGKTPVLERVQNVDKVSEEANQKQFQSAMQSISRTRIESAEPSHKDERADNDEQEKKQQRQQHSARKQSETEDDPDEKEMTHLGFKIDVKI
ncbi:MAG TPA: hypothetical protein ENJ29_12015 [Bacteroidetes bacterium]|nr:hypothetical protein [Bacteroidota bacterium]